MSDKPILFSGEMVRAILDGRKTQTRRVLKCQPLYKSAMYYVMPEDCPKAWQDCSDVIPLCPYGQPGDRLWVRETWARLKFSRDWETGYIDDWKPVALDEPGSFVYDAEPHGYNDNGNTVKERGFAWRPSIFMPRRASRVTLEITDVRVERLQAITPKDCEAEGIVCPQCDGDYWREVGGESVQCPHPDCGDGRQTYRALWDSLNAKRGFGWESNPFVWVISFKRIDASREEPAPAVELSWSYPNERSLTLAALPSTGAETAE